MTGDLTEQLLARARHAMDAALMRAAIAERTSIAALVRDGRGVPHNPACGPRPMRIAIWSEAAYKSVHPKRGAEAGD